MRIPRDETAMHEAMTKDEHIPRVEIAMLVIRAPKTLKSCADAHIAPAPFYAQ